MEDFFGELDAFYTGLQQKFADKAAAAREKRDADDRELVRKYSEILLAAKLETLPESLAPLFVNQAFAVFVDGLAEFLAEVRQNDGERCQGNEVRSVVPNQETRQEQDYAWTAAAEDEAYAGTEQAGAHHEREAEKIEVARAEEHKDEDAKERKQDEGTEEKALITGPHEDTEGDNSSRGRWDGPLQRQREREYTVRQILEECLGIMHTNQFTLYRVRFHGGVMAREDDFHAMAENNTLFVFVCGKGPWMFELELWLTNSFTGGALALRNLCHLPTSMCSRVYCDFRNRNTLPYQSASVLALLASQSWRDFAETRWGFVRELEALLSEAFVVRSLDLGLTAIEEGRRAYPHNLHVELTRGEKRLFLCGNQNPNQEFQVFCTSDPDQLIWCGLDSPLATRLESAEDVRSVPILVDAFFHQHWNEYGHFEFGEWFNEKQVKAFFEHVGRERKRCGTGDGYVQVREQPVDVRRKKYGAITATFSFGQHGVGCSDQKSRQSLQFYHTRDLLEWECYKVSWRFLDTKARVEIVRQRKRSPERVIKESKHVFNGEYMYVFDRMRDFVVRLYHAAKIPISRW